MTLPNTTTTAPPPRPPSLSNETLRERILTGGGTGSNARGSLSKVASRYTDFIRSLASSSSGNNNNYGGESSTPSATATATTASSALQRELLLHDLEIRKLILASRASDGNSARYTSALSTMQTSLTSTQAEIESLTATLHNEKRIKHNREEYNALAKMGNESHPPIRVTQLELERVNGEIEGVKREAEEAKRELNVRERQMRVLLTSLADLKNTLGEEEIRKKKSNQKNDGDSEKSSNDNNDVDVVSMQGSSKRKRTSDGGRSDSYDDIGAL